MEGPFVPPSTTGFDKVAYLVGWPIAHSRSPAMHRALYSAIGQPWAQILAETRDLQAFIQYLKTDPKCMGSGVTMPHKVAVIPLLDELTAEGHAIGAVNTIFMKAGSDGIVKYCGTNTDCIGIRDAFINNVSGSPYRGKPGLVVGGGGTCRAAVYALQKFMGCSPVYVINRDKSEVDAVIEECRARGAGDDLIHIESLEQAQSSVPPGAIVSAIPDFAPVTEAEKVVRQILAHFMSASEKGAILEMCYHPAPTTQIYKLAESLQWQVIGGLEAMIGQGLAQAALWTGIEITPELRSIAREVVSKPPEGH